MAHVRRAAPEVTTSTSAPRRGHTSRIGSVFRKAMAPTAIVGLLVATTTLTFVPVGASESATVADPFAGFDERVPSRASRDFARVPVQSGLPDALYSPSVIPSAVPTPVASPTVEAVPTTPAPVPSVVAPTPAIVEPVETTPAVDWSLEGKDAGSRWSSASVNVRTGPGTTFDVISALVEGSGITITDISHDGWQQISTKNGAGWIKSSFLSENEPVAPTESPSSVETTSSSSKAAASSAKEAPTSSAKEAPTSSAKEAPASSAKEAPASSAKEAPAAGGTCAKAGSAENGMTNNTVSVLRTVCAQFSSITSYGGFRAGSSGYHGSGQAIDAMISGDAGWEVAKWVRSNASSLGVVEVIYQQKIWTSQRSGDGWRSMSSRGSNSADHYDHVHISVG